MNDSFLTQWKALEQLANDDQYKDIKKLFAKDPKRVEKYRFETEDLTIDLSKNWINDEVMTSLLELAEHAGLSKQIDALLSLKTINHSEDKAATHTEQRKSEARLDLMRGRKTMYEVAQKYRSGGWLTGFGKTVAHVVNVGIGGSFLGPKLAVEALSQLQTGNDINIHFLPCVDDVAFQAMLAKIDLKRTVFCLSSKSLGTIETMRNHQSIVNLLEKTTGYQPNSKQQSFVAATANLEKAKKLGIPTSHIMPFDDATGGRFSVWSSIGFPVLMAIGPARFREFLLGAEKIDQHLQSKPLSENVPVLMALLSIWYRNFMGLSAYAVIPYDVRLKHLPAWAQQLMMESNGKMLDNHGNKINHATAPWLFGDHGQLSQHAFFQAFHQGTEVLPIDFIGVMEEHCQAQEFLLINMLAQSAALMNGNDSEQAHNHCPGNRPSTVILMKQLSARSLGQLLALYEHMIFVQSVIWNINCFDQPGVELGKSIARKIVEHLQKNQLDHMQLDASTASLLRHIRQCHENNP